MPEERWKNLTGGGKKLCKNEDVKDCPTRITKQVRVETEKCLKCLTIEAEKGAEGVMQDTKVHMIQRCVIFKIKPFLIPNGNRI